MEIASSVRLKKYFGLCRKGDAKQGSCGEFWDIVCLTAGNERQATGFNSIIKEKLGRGQIPSCCEYIVVPDPGTGRVGNGGALLWVLDRLRSKFHCQSQFLKKKVLLIHSGGYSTRLPNVSDFGKIFAPFPIVCEGEAYCFDLLDCKLMSYIDIANCISGGVFACCADTFEMFPLMDEMVRFVKDGFTALAHPSSLAVARKHGVYVFEAGPELKKKVANELFVEVPMLRFLHKPSEELMRKNGALLDCERVCNEKEFVFTDSTFYIGGEVVSCLLDVFDKVYPFEEEIDAYGDILGSLGAQQDTPPSLQPSKLKKLVFKRLNGIPVSCILAPSSRFFHFGTLEEYILHFCGKSELSNQFEIPSWCCSSCWPAHKDPNPPERTCPQGSLVFQSFIDGNMDTRVLPPSIIEYSVVGAGSEIEGGSVISCCRIPKGTCIPKEIILHTVALKSADATQPLYVTVMFGITDDLKAEIDSGAISEDNRYANRSLSEFKLNESKVWPSSKVTRTLWHAKLFNPCRSPEESLLVTLCGPKIGDNLLSLDDIAERADFVENLALRAECEYLILAARLVEAANKGGHALENAAKAAHESLSGESIWCSKLTQELRPELLEWQNINLPMLVLFNYADYFIQYSIFPHMNDLKKKEWRLKDNEFQLKVAYDYL
eukprot:Nk52_evm49s352 gene=Nk52_evmTU49s352